MTNKQGQDYHVIVLENDDLKKVVAGRMFLGIFENLGVKIYTPEVGTLKHRHGIVGFPMVVDSRGPNI